MGDFLLGQFPGGQRRALAAGPGFIAKDVKLPSGLLRGVERRGGGADVNKRQPASVAMGQDATVGPDQLCPVPPNGLAVADVVIGEFLGRGQGEGLLLGDRFARLHGGADVLHGVGRIDGSGPGGFEGLLNEIDVAQKLAQVVATKRARPLGQSISGCGADGPRSADNHIADGAGRLAIIPHGNNLEAMRQEPLLDEQDGIFSGVESNRAIVLGPAASGDIHRNRGILRRRSSLPVLEGPDDKSVLARFDSNLAHLVLDLLVGGMFAQVLEVRAWDIHLKSR